MKIEKVFKQPDPSPVEKIVVEFTPEEWLALKCVCHYYVDRLGSSTREYNVSSDILVS